MTEATARLRVVAPPELAAGFGLGGATVHAVESASRAAETVDALIAEGERGVIAVYGPWLDDFDRTRRDQLEESVAPVVVAVPSGLVAEAGAARRARLAGLLQRAVGYHITFEEGGT
ncbi:MAG: V-type ATP synthase subunit F [Ilumatobacter sp.]|uniref:V-type ATP synthase subunit F n=1 Tax=Ilumatobacter sp. TaxID=1967498 RepID=UPI0026353D5F|nr:V-type ATP synthase subunit F [Ilumatobacter sp.]MDJ0768326.1 V-type ATP synthase subunit F [Ilumatobacter sp.]